MNPGIIQDVRPGVDDSFVIIIGVQNHPYVPIPIIYFSSNWIQIRCMLQFFWQKYKSIRYGETRQRKLRKITKISSIPTYLSAKSAQKIRIWVLRLSCYAWKILLNYSNTESKVVYPQSRHLPDYLAMSGTITSWMWTNILTMHLIFRCRNLQETTPIQKCIFLLATTRFSWGDF